MNVGIVAVPNNWQTCKSEVKDCLEFYTLIAAKPFRVDVLSGGKNPVEIRDRKNLNDEQNDMLEFAVNDFNLRVKNSPSQDPCVVAIQFRKKLEEDQKRLSAPNFRKSLLEKIKKAGKA
jgi:hypothetical protein